MCKFNSSLDKRANTELAALVISGIVIALLIAAAF